VDPVTGEPLPGEGDDTAEPPADAGPFPEHLRRQQNSVRRTGPNGTGALIEALAPLAQFGVSPQDAALVGFGRFPVAGEARYSHDWWFPRFGPGWRLHMGTDIFAAMGTPVRAPSDGRVRITNSGLGGLAVYVVEPNGSFVYLAHLSGVADGVTQGTPVTVGQVVGFVGDSGNARGGSPHLHIEFHPGGGSATDPKPILDGFLDEAIAGAPAIIQRYADAAAAGDSIPAPASPGSSGALGEAGPLEAPRATLLWATAMSPSGGALALAEAEATRVAGSVDWTAFRTQQLAGEAQRTTNEVRIERWFAPLTPPSLAGALAQG
jgi:murein DD-endopeptidase MepM/ murein hydrolase activator NlpD